MIKSIQPTTIAANSQAYLQEGFRKW